MLRIKMTEELKPCPFCNSNELDVFYGNMYSNIHCKKCACRLVFDSGTLREDIEKAWNKRPGPCERCERLDKYVSTKIDENYYKCGLWMAERIKKELTERIQFQVQQEKLYIGSKVALLARHTINTFDDFRFKIDKILEEERQRQESKK